jgi:Serine/threonine protein kinase
MSFRPNVHDELTLNGVTYRIAEHPAAPGIPYGQEGRAGIVYCLETLTPSPSPAQPPGVGVRAALKVFKPRFRMPYLVSQAEKLAAFADLPGLQAARRRVLTRVQNPDLLQQHPDLIYAVLMPWIEGPTWFDILMDRKPLSPETSLALAHSLAQVLARMEEQGIAHCDLSAPNVMLPLLAGGTGVELVDLEGLYAPGMTRPQELSSGSAGYAHRQATGGLWGPEADRFAGAVLLAEMLGWCDPQVVQAAWGESYFAPQEMQQDTPRYHTLVAALERRWGSNVARLFERAWRSDSCWTAPPFGEWMVALPLTPSPQPPSPLPQAGEGKGVAAQPPGEEVRAAVEPTAEIRAFMQVARRFEEQNNYQAALEAYRQALELARADPSLRSLAREIELTVQDVEKRIAAQARRPQPAIPPLPVEEGPGVSAVSPLPPGEGAGVRGVRAKRPWGRIAAGLVALALLAAIVYGVNLQQQQAAQATATAIAWQEQSTATARAQATATAQAQATVTARAAQATATVQVGIL